MVLFAVIADFNYRGLSKYLLCVDVNVVKDENEIIRIYGKRWDIEVFFKICKLYLKLTKECRSLSYDEMADINWMQAFQILMDTFLSTLTDKLSLTSSQLKQFMDYFFEALPSSTKKCLGLCI